MSIPQLTTIDQARPQTKPPSTRHRARTKRAYVRVVVFATQPSAPTLQQLQETAAGCLADYIIAWIEMHGGCVDFNASVANVAEQGQGGVA